MTSSLDRYDFIGRARQRNLQESLRERRRLAVQALTEYCVKVTRDGRTVDELVFDTRPTLAQLVERAGQDATVVSIESMKRTVLVAGRTAEAAK